MYRFILTISLTLLLFGGALAGIIQVTDKYATIQFQEEYVLKSARIVFIIPEGDDKDTDTKVSVKVTTRFKKFDRTIASKYDFAGNDTWEDTGGKEYTYDLSAKRGYPESQLNDIKITISINPVGNDTVKFGYRLILVFDDNDAATDPDEITKEEHGITLSQDNRIYISE